MRHSVTACRAAPRRSDLNPLAVDLYVYSRSLRRHGIANRKKEEVERMTQTCMRCRRVGSAVPYLAVNCLVWKFENANPADFASCFCFFCSREANVFCFGLHWELAQTILDEHFTECLLSGGSNKPHLWHCDCVSNTFAVAQHGSYSYWCKIVESPKVLGKEVGWLIYPVQQHSFSRRRTPDQLTRN